MSLLVFAVTLFVSAFILFLVQPIIGKLILPKLGGTPQVWNTCMVFFQMVLLAGYAYTHTVSTKVKLRTQLIIHGVLLLAPFFFLFFLGNHPFDVSGWIPPPGANPLFATLSILTVLVGIPFFVVSTSAPLLQKWFVHTGHHTAKDPYFLYAASNVGSLLALILYPALVEPFMRLTPQTWLYAFSYIGLVGLIFVSIAMVWKPAGQEAKLALADHPEPAPLPEPVVTTAQASTAVTAAPSAAKSAAIKKGGKPTGKFAPPRRDLPKETPEIGPSRGGDEMTTWRRLRWIGLAAVPSSLMLGVTTHITTDLSPIPLFWLLPLTLYLLSFILVFSRWPVPWVGVPHTYVLYTQPIFIALMIFFDFLGTGSDLLAPIVCNLLGFFATALVCHGELAKDRPGTKHLTEFYLMMSVGGMVGGMFNGLIAPVVFIWVLVFGIAVVAACLLRPKLKEGGWSDDLISGLLEPQAAAAAAHKGAKTHHGRHHPVTADVTASETTSTAMDIILPIANAVLMFLLAFVILGRPTADSRVDIGMHYFLMFGIVLVISCLYYGRPLRYGLTIAAVLIVHAFYMSNQENVLFRDRSYYGIIRIRLGYTPQAQGSHPYSTLIHGHIDHGMNLFKPSDEADWYKPEKDFSRLATTYYHRLGPAGRVMEKYNWFKPKESKVLNDVELNTYQADLRMPASLVALGGGVVGHLDQFVGLWAEPPYAIIGLGTGTMASYGRPYQHVHYYEIDNHIRRLSLPVHAARDGKVYFTYSQLKDIPLEPFTYEVYRPGSGSRPKTFFTYLKDAIKRGSEVEVLMGDARLRMARPYVNFHSTIEADDKEKGWKKGDKGWEVGGGPDGFYHMMVVDAFTSDAIPAHLLTKQSFEMYFTKLAEKGILCVHTSNRYVDLTRVVADIASDMGYAYRRGRDSPSDEAKHMGHHTSEWVMVARQDSYLRDLTVPAGYSTKSGEPYWSVSPQPSGGRYLWTDDYYNLLSIMRIFHPRD